MKMMSRLLLMLCICFSSFAAVATEITPHIANTEELYS